MQFFFLRSSQVIKKSDQLSLEKNIKGAVFDIFSRKVNFKIKTRPLKSCVESYNALTEYIGPGDDAEVLGHVVDRKGTSNSNGG